ncbi:hypothetical protein SteCoe_4101 [Stentor coeruleus]|uniref:PPM-type phosphatase domain-containing protein n=1 Tax=Stentor coeruleus TaxID=5963 RepID=A0A1R2CVL1_9CILI|nr:hypothetical protein SteCoe_4101 [Stentor coeruleus]
MGNSCCQSKQVQYFEHFEYNSKVVLRIIERDKRSNYRGTSNVPFEVNPPIDQLYSIFDIGKAKYRAYGCVIPGQDPRGEVIKQCQDAYSFLVKDNIFFGMLFDGHGKEGQKVAQFCKEFMSSYFLSNTKKFEKHIPKTLEELVLLTDRELCLSQIDTYLSGSTAVVIVLNSDGVFVGSLGDSRAILATLPKDKAKISIPCTCAPFKRVIHPSRILSALPLTVDQKPNHEDELKRIRRAGGVVERVTNDIGNPIGPYRVWKRRGSLPGLAMSRSLGDRLAHEIGVISVPVVNCFEFYPALDQFIVVASDGVWDVMENIEVINLVDKFRNNTASYGNTYPAKSCNTTIARLVCEEARYRWFGIVEDEDVMIDDISCFVIELSSVEPGLPWDSENIVDRTVNTLKSIVICETFDIEDNQIVRKDPTRGSVMEDKTSLEIEVQE